MSHFALGIGVGTKNRAGEWLEVFFLDVAMNVSSQKLEGIAKIIERLGQLNEVSPHIAGKLLGKAINASQGRRKHWVVVSLEKDLPLQSVPETYLKLQLLSRRLARPNSLDLSNIFKVLPNVAWTSDGAIDARELEEERRTAICAGQRLKVESVDKFPPLLDYTVPSGVRISDGARVRLGAYLGEGTTVMHEGFVNFNAGCEGPNMIEGRISAGVFVDANSDLGGSSSTMGTLSGGGKVQIRLGKNCLLGANSGLGIPLGDRCTVEAGLYVTAGAKVRLVDQSGKEQGYCKARELSGKDGLLFRRNSQTGAIECLASEAIPVLNPILHKN